MQKIDKNALQLIRNHVHTLSEIDEDNVEERKKEIPKRIHEIFVRFMYECNELKELEVKKLAKHGELYKHYKFFDNHSWGNKGEIESQICSDKTYQYICREYNKQEYIVKELEGFFKNLKDLMFQVKNTIDLMKFKSGITW